MACCGHKGETCRGMVREWAENSALNGVPNIVRAESPLRKIVWVLLFMFCSGYMIEECYQLVDKFFDYGVTTGIQLQFSPKLTFPAVTICNVNSIKKSKLSRAGTEISDLLEPPTPSGNGPSSNVTTTTTSSNATAHHQKRLENDKKFKRLWAQLSVQDKMDAGHELNSMILSCTFNGAVCDVGSEWIQTHNQQYGNCYMFNSGFKTKAQDITKSGPTYGLAMELFIEQYEYIDDLSEDAGIRLSIHDQNVMPFPEDNGYNAAPGFMTSIGVRKTELSRQGFPYPSRCVNYATQAASKAYNMFSSLFNVRYTTEACYKTCFQQHVIEQCSCGDTRYPYQEEFESLSASWTKVRRASAGTVNVRPCINDKEDVCINDVETQYSNGTLGCNCPLACSENDFMAFPSFSKWPSNAYRQTVLDTLAESSDPMVANILFGKNNKTADPDSNLLKLRVYYDALNYQSITETPAYPVLSLLADLGGQIGFWVGLSVLAAFEVLELLLDFFRIILMKMCGLGKINNSITELEIFSTKVASPPTGRPLSSRMTPGEYSHHN